MNRLDPAAQRQFAGEVVGQLRVQGFQAFWAGGCVRDKLLGRSPKDYDVVTDARPEQIRQLFGVRRTLAIGAAFGVITVLGPKGAGQVEVTTFRRDAEYRDGRHPETVQFSSPEEDAARRDFTINGMFYDPAAEQLIDYVGGADDLGRRIVRAIGRPQERFAEDKLRMLRAIRFAAGFGFELETATEDAIKQMAAEVTVVSAERIAAEMQLMLTDPHRARAVRLLHRTRLLSAILPEVALLGDASASAAEPWQQTLALLESLNEPTFALALAALLDGVDDSQFANTVGRRWRLARKDFERAAWLLKTRALLPLAGQVSWSRLQPALIHPGSKELLALGSAEAEIGLLDPAALELCLDLVDMSPSNLNPPPLITGQDLIAQGVPRGSAYARLLREVRDAQLDGSVTDKQQALAKVKELLDAWEGAG
jgi:tRNA nucleotidyltransferase/poly(A) polymerase